MDKPDYIDAATWEQTKKNVAAAKRTNAKRMAHDGWRTSCIVDDRAAVFRVKRLEGATACDP